MESLVLHDDHYQRQSECAGCRSRGVATSLRGDLAAAQWVGGGVGGRVSHRRRGCGVRCKPQALVYGIFSDAGSGGRDGAQGGVVSLLPGGVLCPENIH